MKEDTIINHFSFFYKFIQLQKLKAARKNKYKIDNFEL